MSRVIVRSEATSEDTMQSLLSYAIPFEKNCGIRSVVVNITNILDDIISSKFRGCQLNSNKQTIYYSRQADNQTPRRTAPS